MEQRVCYVCGKNPLSKDEVGISKKLINRNTDKFYCLHCLAEQFEITEDELRNKIEEFKAQGCTLFN